MSNLLALSDEQRHTILMIEVLGLLHDIGKLSDGFLRSQDPSISFVYETSLVADPTAIYPTINPSVTDSASIIILNWQSSSNATPFRDRSDLTTTLQQFVFTDWNGDTYNLAELFAITRPGNQMQSANWQLVTGKSMQPALLVGMIHGIAHYEKETPPDQNKQHYSSVYRSTPLGKEKQVSIGNPGELTKTLCALPLRDIGKMDTTERDNWLEYQMKPLIKLGIADNRRPTNEVSLWDWGFTVASLAKAAVVWIYQHGSQHLDQLAWRTLRINLDIPGRYMRSDHISDVLGLQAVLDDSFSQVQHLLEDTYAFANCFYRDETGVYYLFPDVPFTSDLKQEIQQCFPSDLQPLIYLEDILKASQLDPKSQHHNPQAINMLIAEPRKRALQMLEHPIHSDNNLYPWHEEWAEQRPENAPICPVCGVRPVGYPSQAIQAKKPLGLHSWATQKKAEQRNVCRVCLDRRGRPAETWGTGDLSGTIWIDEVSDENSRLALFIGTLDLEGWLDGTLIQSLFVTRNKHKNASPARLYRIAETAREFWQHVIEHITTTTIGHRPYRLALYPDESKLNDIRSELGPFHSYELDVDGVALSVLWDSAKTRFITTDNLAAFAKRWEGEGDLEYRLQGSSFRLAEPSAYLQRSQDRGTVHIVQVERLNGYHPMIPILSEPGVCMFLIPARQALELADAVKSYYEDQMNKVRDRLPMHLGLIFFSRRTPIGTVLDAGRKMLHMGGKWVWEAWEVVDPSDPRVTLCSTISTTTGSQTVTFAHGVSWNISITTGDKNISDNWYPYLLTQCPVQGQTIQTKHVSKLRSRHLRAPIGTGEKVYIRPSRFDFEFLDTTGRRFEINYTETGRRMSRPTRPFLLDDIDRLNTIWHYMRHLKRAQRHQVIYAIEATRELWCHNDTTCASWTDQTFRQFVKDTLAGAEWWQYPHHNVPHGQKQKKISWSQIGDDTTRALLIEAGVRGELADLAELHHQILKEDEYVRSS